VWEIGKGRWRWCQKDANQSQFTAKPVNLCGTKLTPLGKSRVSVQFEILTAEEATLLIEVIVHGKKNDDDFLQTSPAPETQHCPLTSSKWLMLFLGPIVRPATGFLLFRVANVLHGSIIGAKLIG